MDKVRLWLIVFLIIHLTVKIIKKPSKQTLRRHKWEIILLAVQIVFGAIELF